MDILHPHVCGIDVHAKFAVACCRHIGSTGTVTKTSRTVGTMTDDLQALAAWLRAAGVTHVAIESTGVLWQPVWNILEEHVTVVLVNPRDVRQVPGRKTDVTDAEWLAQLLQYGLLRNSFVPPAAIRELRDLTRGRAKLVDQTTAIANRIHAARRQYQIGQRRQ
jgi:transposase